MTAATLPTLLPGFTVPPQCSSYARPVPGTFAEAVLCDDRASVIRRVSCPEGHSSDVPLCGLHGDLIDACRDGDELLCRPCAVAGRDGVPVLVTEARP